MKERDLFKKTVGESLADKEKIRHSAKRQQPKTRMPASAWKRGLAVAVVCLIVGLGALTGMLAVFSPVEASNHNSAHTVNSYGEIFSVIETFNNRLNSFNVTEMLNGFFAAKSFDTNAVSSESFNSAAGNAASGSADRTSETNVQTEGMDEGDLVKVKGRYIYKLNSAGCSIIYAGYDGTMSLASSISTDNYVPIEMYVSDDGNKLVMIGGIYSYSGNLVTRVEPMFDWCYYIGYNRTNIQIYDISSKESPVLEREITVDGSYNTSRLDTENNRLYYIVNYSFYYGSDEKYIPNISDSMINDGEDARIPAESLYYYDDIANYNYLIIGYIDLDAPQQEAKQSAYLGLSGTIYMSADNIFVATYDYYTAYETNLFGWIRNRNNATVKTRIVRIALSDLEQKALTRVNGTIKDRYSLDEYNGYLRVAATVSSTTVSSSVYVLNSSLELTSKIDNIAEGEVIYAVRFNKDTGSLVTFLQIDPYYRLDLSDPYNIQISEGLKKPGVSYYIHYIEGTDYTIGIGRTSSMDSGWQQWTGLEIILYYNDPSDPLADPVIVTELFLPGNCYAEVLYEPKALLYDKELGILGFAYERWNYNSLNYYYTSMEQGFALFGFDTEAADDDNKLIYRGTLSNLGASIDMSYNYNNYYNTYWSFISRGVFIGDYIYTISDRFITSYNMGSLEQIDKIELR